jgi:hypothetical protein
MKCLICNKDFIGRKTARFCSSTCRSKSHRATDISVATDNLATDKSATPNATDKVTPKDSCLCKIEGCNLKNIPGHNDMCIYHWRKSEDSDTIPVKEYNILNTVETYA